MALKLRSRLLQNVFRPIESDRLNKVREIFQRIKNFQTPEKFKGTFIEKWGSFWKQLFLDYKDVAVDVCKEFKERPFKSCFYVSMLGSGVYLAKHNPDENCFRQDVLNSCSEIILIGEQIRNPKSTAHIQMLNDCYTEGIIRRLNLGVISFIWLDNYKEGLALYKAVCPYLKPRYVTFYERIIDVGFLDTWWILKDKMRDYDINEEELNTPSPSLLPT